MSLTLSALSVQDEVPEAAAARGLSPALTPSTRQHCFSRLLTLLGWACKPAGAAGGRRAAAGQQGAEQGADRGRHAVAGFAGCLASLHAAEVMLWPSPWQQLLP